MTVYELIKLLQEMPAWAQVEGLYATDFNHRFNIESVELKTQEWTYHQGGKYLAIEPRVVLS